MTRSLPSKLKLVLATGTAKRLAAVGVGLPIHKAPEKPAEKPGPEKEEPKPKLDKPEADKPDAKPEADKPKADAPAAGKGA
jgi:hypothetical protein